MKPLPREIAARVYGTIHNKSLLTSDDQKMLFKWLNGGGAGAVCKVAAVLTENGTFETEIMCRGVKAEATP